MPEDTGTFGNGVMQILSDIDDSKEGVRMHGNTSQLGGPNELDEESWEMGEMFFRNWWWAVDSRTLRVTNKRRRERGLGRLKLENVKAS